MFDRFFFLSDFGGNGSLSDEFSLEPLMTLLNQVIDFLVNVQSQTLEKVILQVRVLHQFRKALTERLNVLRLGGFEFQDRDGLSNPIDLRVPFSKPGHPQNDLRFSEVKYHEPDSLQVRGSKVVFKGKVDDCVQSDVSFVVGRSVNVVGFEWSGEGSGQEI